jgi:hypothetical protein
MKSLFSLFIVAPLVCALGCNSSPPGGPNASKPDANKSLSEKAHDAGIGTAENTFRISLPTLETGLKQGETKAVKISISRGKNFDQDVNLALSGLPKGVTATPASPVIKASDKEIDVSFVADKDAAVGNHTVHVTATPAKDGAATSADLKIEVKKP